MFLLAYFEKEELQVSEEKFESVKMAGDFAKENLYTEYFTVCDSVQSVDFSNGTFDVGVCD